MAHASTRPGLEFESPILELEQKIEELRNFSQTTQVDLSDQIEKLLERCNEKKRAIFSKLTPWQRVLTARHPKRPLTTDYVQFLIEDFVEVHGDRAFRDDPAMLTGFGRLDGHRVFVAGHRKGKDTQEKLACFFGCPHPEGYRKALLKMKLAEKFGVPIVTLINTPGAYPGIGAEERGQAFIIAKNLIEMAGLRVPVIACVIGEGGSGGALGIGVGNRLLMFEHSYYSVISPEGCAAILWKSSDFKERASEILKLTAEDLHGFGIVDEVLEEPLGGAHRDPIRAAHTLKASILRHLKELSRLSGDDLVRDRYSKLRRIGLYAEVPEVAPRVPEPALAR